MPFHKLSDEQDRNSFIEWTTDDRVSSQGAFNSTLTKIPGKSGTEKCHLADDVFKTVHGLKVRRIEPRNTPTVINAVYNHRNFWDGRANNVFNGIGVFGPRDIKHNKSARLLYDKNGDGKLDTSELTYLHMINASLASQAVGPPLSDTEMSCAGRTFADVGRKLLSPAVRPLENQEVHPTDSVLASYRHSSGKGLNSKYEDLIMQAFADSWWNAKGSYVIEKDGALKQFTQGKGAAKDGYTQMEHNFSLFWGIAIMAYEATLISDQSPFDKMIDSQEITITLGINVSSG